jgi:hypothetical protein
MLNAKYRANSILYLESKRMREAHPFALINYYSEALDYSTTWTSISIVPGGVSRTNLFCCSCKGSPQLGH